MSTRRQSNLLTGAVAAAAMVTMTENAEASSHGGAPALELALVTYSQKITAAGIQNNPEVQESFGSAFEALGKLKTCIDTNQSGESANAQAIQELLAFEHTLEDAGHAELVIPGGSEYMLLDDTETHKYLPRVAQQVAIARALAEEHNDPMLQALVEEMNSRYAQIEERLMTDPQLVEDRNDPDHELAHSAYDLARLVTKLAEQLEAMREQAPEGNRTL